MNQTPRRGLAIALCVVVAATFLSASPGFGRTAPGAPETLQLSSDLRVTVAGGRGVQLEILASAADDSETIARRLTGGDDADAQAIAVLNGGGEFREGQWVRVPLALLAPNLRAMVLRNLFPRDRRDGEDWIHVARAGVLPIYDEGLWQVAEWFTGRGSAFEELMRANGLSSPETRKNQEIRVPAALLSPAFRARMRSDDGLLEFDSDADGPYAVYRLRKGEALYSAVIVKFTGRTGAEDVGAVAALLGERSNIPDLRDIPVGFGIKIPLELLEPEFLPAGHPSRLEVEARREELARELEQRPVAGTRGGLEGVLVVLDPGHGGRDLGTIKGDIWEHDYVYDVACRLKQKLEQETAARVLLTLEDRETGCVPSRGDALKRNMQGTILTDPPFLAREEGEAKIGVNLRWYLANSIYRAAKKEGTDADRVVFMSLHADSRHPALRGLMVYVPGASYRTKTYGHDSRRYRAYKEVREKPFVHFSHKERVRSEAVSQELADAIVASYKDQDLPVQPYKPVRAKIVRGKQRFVPAVLRSNAVPTKVLVEMVNLSNQEDRAILRSARERDRLADGLMGGLLSYFGETPSVASINVAD